MNKQTWFSQGKTKQKRLIRAMKFFFTFCIFNRRIMLCLRNIFSGSIILYQLQ